MKEYNFLLVEAGLFNAALGRKLTNAGYKCLIIDKRDHIGGNCYTERTYNIDVHMYGPHIFHTNNKLTWEFANRYAEFVPYQQHTNKIKEEPIDSSVFDLGLNRVDYTVSAFTGPVPIY